MFLKQPIYFSTILLFLEGWAGGSELIHVQKITSIANFVINRLLMEQTACFSLEYEFNVY